MTNLQFPFRVPHTGINIQHHVVYFTTEKGSKKGIDGLRSCTLYIYTYALFKVVRGGAGGFCPLCIFKLNRVYAIS